MKNMKINYERLNADNFNAHSLDDFVRHQKVSECWRNVNGEWKLVPICFEENWSLEKCQEIAADVVLHFEKDQSAFGAFDGEKLVGFITVSHEIFGKTAKYAELIAFKFQSRTVAKELEKSFLRWLVTKLEKSVQKNCTFRGTLQKKVRLHTKRCAAFTQKKSMKHVRKKNLAMFSWNIV